MKIDVTEQRGATIVKFDGDVDLQTSPDARKALLDAVKQGRPMLVDLSAVSYIDSSGVASLIEALQSARGAALNLCLVSVSSSAMRVLELANLQKVFNITETIEAGLDAIG